MSHHVKDEWDEWDEWDEKKFGETLPYPL